MPLDREALRNKVFRSWNRFVSYSFFSAISSTYNVTKLVTMIKSITARQIFKDFPQVKKQLWGGEFWSDGYFANTVGKHGDENMIRKYVQDHGVKQLYKKLHDDYQLRMFE